MRVAVPKEIRAGEKRVALVPDVINKFTKLGFEVIIESGAGIHAQAGTFGRPHPLHECHPGNLPA